jgi:threonine aldolase
MEAGMPQRSELKRVIDLRSDLLTRPTPEMVASMVEALRDAPSFELRNEDERQRRVEARVAQLTGQEDALLFPTCTMANQAALAILTRPGDAVLTQRDAHIVTSEAGGPSAISGLQVETVPGDPALPVLERWTAMTESSQAGTRARITAFVLENTHNRAGGRALPVDYIMAVLAEARRLGVSTHLDGARLFNAAVAHGCNTETLAGGFDSVAISLNKGLGAPFGAALAGSRNLIDAALAWRQRLGGGMRRYGPLAAAAEIALADFGHLRDDHRRAKRLGQELEKLPLCSLDSSKIETNIVILEVGQEAGPAARLCATMEGKGIKLLPLDENRLRLTMYRGIGDDDIDRIIETFRGLGSRPR